jgi:hypothetical protein
MKNLVLLTAILLFCAGCSGQNRDVSTVTEFEQVNRYAKLQHDLAQQGDTRLRIYHDLVPSITASGHYSTFLRISSLTARGDVVIEQRYEEQLP